MVLLLPHVDFVFQLPVDQPSDEAYGQTYLELGCTFLGTSAHHPLLPLYEKHMAQYGGHVFTETDLAYSATQLISFLTDPEISERIMYNAPMLLRLERSLEKTALEAGFLRDLIEQ